MHIIIPIITALAAWAAIHRVACFIEQDWLREEQQQTLHEQFEMWWLSVATKNPKEFVLGVLQSISNALSSFFGPRLFSRRALRRAKWVSLSLLMATTALYALSGRAFYPWETYNDYIKIARATFEKQAHDLSGQKGPQAEAQLKVLATFNRILVKADRLWYNILYCTVLIIAVAGGTVVAFFLTTGLSRMILAEIVASGRPATVVLLLILNLYLSASILGLFMLWTETFSSPIMLPGLLITIILASLSFYWVIAMVFNGGLAAWVFGHALLKAVAVIVILPSIASILTCVFALVALYARDTVHKLCCGFLIRCSRNPLGFTTGSLGLIVIAFATFSRLLFRGH